MNCLDDYIDRLDDAVERGELTEQEAREDLWWEMHERFTNGEVQELWG